MKLYEMTNGYKQLLEMATEGETEPEVLQDTMEGLEGDIQDKVEGIVKVMKTIEAEEKALKEEEERIYNRRKALENKRDSMKEYITNNMITAEMPKIKTSLFSLSLRNCQSVKVTDETKLPDMYLIPQPAKVDKKGITEALKNGEIIPGAEFETKQSLTIK